MFKNKCIKITHISIKSYKLYWNKLTVKNISLSSCHLFHPLQYLFTSSELRAWILGLQYVGVSVVVAVQSIEMAEPPAVGCTVGRAKRDLSLSWNSHLRLEKAVAFVFGLLVVLIAKADSSFLCPGMTPASINNKGTVRGLSGAKKRNVQEQRKCRDKGKGLVGVNERNVQEQRNMQGQSDKGK